MYGVVDSSIIASIFKQSRVVYAYDFLGNMGITDHVLSVWLQFIHCVSVLLLFFLSYYISGCF